MKVFPVREPDLQDIKHLAGALGSGKASDAIRIYERAYAGWLVMEKTRREVADAREERGEPVPALTLEENRTLRAKGARSRSLRGDGRGAGRRQRDTAGECARPRSA